MAIKCPKCPVTANVVSGGWTFEPRIGCVDLAGTSWGEKAELKWCPTLAAAMPKDTIWPGRAQRALVEEEIAMVRASKEL
jgi:hypothetical protein